MAQFEGISRFFHYKKCTEFAAMLVFSWLDPPLHITILCKDINFLACRPYRPVGLSTDQSLFTGIIVYNDLSLIVTKYLSMHSWVRAVFVFVQKIRKKLKFWSLIYQKWFTCNFKCSFPLSAGTSTTNLVFFGLKIMDLLIHEHCNFVIPVNISLLFAWASWAARHTTVCLDCYQRKVNRV